MQHYILEPEVAGQLGPETVMDSTTHPPRVDRLHYVLDGWLGDDLLESFPCYVVTSKLRKGLEAAEIGGIVFDTVKIGRSDTFLETNGNRAIPEFHWMKVSGRADTDDLFLEDNMLVASKAALSVLQQYEISNCDIEER